MNYQNPEKGELLKQVRESKDISLETVHETTKIPMDILRAIEEGYTVRTLTPFYYKGFLKIYAQYLGVELKDILDEVPEPSIVEKVEGHFDEEDFSKVISKFFTKERKNFIAKLLVVFFTLFVFAKIVGLIRSFFISRKTKAKVTQTKRKVRSQQKKQSKKKTSKTIKPSQVVQTVASREKAPSPPKPQVAAPVSTTVSLTVRAKNNSWLRVKSDGTVVFQSTLKKGASETWTAKEKIELSGKNINSLDIELNGKMIGNLGRSDRKIRKIVATKDGLSVNK